MRGDHYIIMAFAKGYLEAFNTYLSDFYCCCNNETVNRAINSGDKPKRVALNLRQINLEMNLDL